MLLYGSMSLRIAKAVSGELSSTRPHRRTRQPNHQRRFAMGVQTQAVSELHRPDCVGPEAAMQVHAACTHPPKNSAEGKPWRVWWAEWLAGEKWDLYELHQPEEQARRGVVRQHPGNSQPGPFKAFWHKSLRPGKCNDGVWHHRSPSAPMRPSRVSRCPG